MAKLVGIGFSFAEMALSHDSTFPTDKSEDAEKLCCKNFYSRKSVSYICGVEEDLFCSLPIREF